MLLYRILGKLKLGNPEGNSSKCFKEFSKYWGIDMRTFCSG
jgi:hypothetical protein